MIKILSVNEIKRKPDLREVTDNEQNKYVVLSETVFLNNILPEASFERDEWYGILTESDYKIGLNYALDYISRGMKTQKEIKNKLFERKIRENAVEQILTRLRELDYVNDRKYALEYVGVYSDIRGSIRLRNELYLRGVDRKHIDEALDTLTDEGPAALNAALKFTKGRELDNKERERLIRHLLSRGFPYDAIKTALRQMGKETDDISDL